MVWCPSFLPAASSATHSSRTNKTLNRGRAERNESILLQEFRCLKYIVPDKQYSKKTAPVVKQEGGEPAHRRHAKVVSFEPKRGLWDKYILVMDFDSLHPSIKVEEVCFLCLGDHLRYKHLEIDLGGVFQRLLLLQEKKYDMLKVEDGSRTKTEVKGLDMKCREYCALSKNISK
jgi:DNA polymerase elongation subunit (family B)